MEGPRWAAVGARSRWTLQRGGSPGMAPARHRPAVCLRLDSPRRRFSAGLPRPKRAGTAAATGCRSPAAACRSAEAHTRLDRLRKSVARDSCAAPAQESLRVGSRDARAAGEFFFFSFSLLPCRIFRAFLGAFRRLLRSFQDYFRASLPGRFDLELLRVRGRDRSYFAVKRAAPGVRPWWLAVRRSGCAAVMRR